MPQAQIAYEIFYAVFAFILGANIGSFLNVCIYRMPRGLSVGEPKRSFCPSCKYQIPWCSNLPLVTWLVQRAKCANCRAPISFRYFGVELLTGLLFLALWAVAAYSAGLRGFPGNWPLAFPLFILGALLVTATFIDFEHYIIPDEITLGGAAAGLVCSVAVPMLHGEVSWGVSECLRSLGWSAVGAVTGWLLLRAVVEAGKLAFGKRDLALAGSVPFSWKIRTVETPEGPQHDADLVVGDPSGNVQTGLVRRMLEAFRLVKPRSVAGEAFVWSETFGRDSDRLIIKAAGATVDGEKLGDCELVFHYDRLSVAGRTWELEKLVEIRGTTAAVRFPQEAMGLGDVKLMACIGAFLGWKAALFTVMAGSVLGAVIGATLAMTLSRSGKSVRIPFGPYLAAGALLWIFAGPKLVGWYLALIAAE